MHTDEIRTIRLTKTPAVSRLRVLGRLIDQLDRELDRVAFLEDQIVDKRKYQEACALAKKAKARLSRTRDSIAKHGGSTIAKGYK
jgi:hypothetical protein